MSNYFVQELVLYRHFMLIDSPIPFELIANPTNFRKDERGNILNTDLSEITGRDICSRPAGAWRVDCWTLLPEKYHKQNPVFTMLIKYDRDLLEDGEEVDIRYSDIDIGEGVAGVNGQLVDIPASAFRPVVLAIEEVSSKIGSTSDSGTVLNELEQIRTKIKSPISSGDSSPWGSILDALTELRTSLNKTYKHLTSFPGTQGYVYEVYGGSAWGTGIPAIVFEVLTVVITNVSGSSGMTYGSGIKISGFDKSGTGFEYNVSATGPFSGYDLHVVYSIPTIRGF